MITITEQPLMKYILGLRHLSPDEGFTLIELIVVTILVGFLAAIGVPSWRGFVNQQRINAAKEIAFSSIRNAQSQSIQTRSNYRASFRSFEVDGEPQIQFAIHPTTLTYKDSNSDSVYDTNDSDGIAWENLESAVELDTEKTNFDDETLGGSKGYYVEFDFKGFLAKGISGQGAIVFQGANTNSSAQRCIVMSTLLGAMRSAQDGDCD